jgi:hypothetical protein
MNDKEPKWGGRLSPEDDIWMSLESYGINPDDLSPESVKQWESIREQSQSLMHTGLGLGLSDTTQHFLGSQAATVAGVLREEAAANRELQRLEEQRKQLKGSSLGSWLRRRRR